MKDHERKMLASSGMLAEPVSNRNVDECVRWYFETLRYRRKDNESNMYLNLIPSDIKELVKYVDTYLDFDYLIYVACGIDDEYFDYVFRARLAEQKKAS